MGNNGLLNVYVKTKSLLSKIALMMSRMNRAYQVKMSDQSGFFSESNISSLVG